LFYDHQQKECRHGTECRTFERISKSEPPNPSNFLHLKEFSHTKKNNTPSPEGDFDHPGSDDSNSHIKCKDYSSCDHFTMHKEHSRFFDHDSSSHILFYDHQQKECRHGTECATFKRISKSEKPNPSNFFHLKEFSHTNKNNTSNPKTGNVEPTQESEKAADSHSKPKTTAPQLKLTHLKINNTRTESKEDTPQQKESTQHIIKLKSDIKTRFQEHNNNKKGFNLEGDHCWDALCDSKHGRTTGFGERTYRDRPGKLLTHLDLKGTSSASSTGYSYHILFKTDQSIHSIKFKTGKNNKHWINLSDTTAEELNERIQELQNILKISPPKVEIANDSQPTSAAVSNEDEASKLILNFLKSAPHELVRKSVPTLFLNSGSTFEEVVSKIMKKAARADEDIERFNLFSLVSLLMMCSSDSQFRNLTVEAGKHILLIQWLKKEPSLTGAENSGYYLSALISMITSKDEL
ncbi:MAG: hypothetical protein HRT90_10495, partial [Candidatus Margulisbacteria bacterium]|nr:hypothetical protein [Candidatus Margulisiibacteriota bacterium]